jgi:transposase
MNSPTQQVIQRYIAIDAHKHYLVIGGLNAQMEIVLPLQRISISRFSLWAQKNFTSTDAVVIEATTNTWTLHDIIAPLVGSAVVANPYQVKLIAAARVKTDKHDVWSLARLLVADLIPEVWVPPQHVRELRALVSHRRRLVQIRTRARNRMHSLLHRHNLSAPTGKPFAAKHHDWWLSLDLSPSERLRLGHDLEIEQHLSQQLDDVEQELNRLTTVEPWASSYPYLVQLPGFGLIVSMTILAAVGDISRFPTAKHLVGYAGLGASVHDSGKTHRTGRITKQGRKDLRWVLVQAAWSAVKTHPYWKEQFERLARRKHKNKAIVAIARKLLVVVWHVLSECTADRNADQEMVAFKLMMWSWELGKERRNGLTTPQFVRAGLMRLQMGEDLSHVVRGGQLRPIAPVEEVLALQSQSEPSP